MRIHPADQPNKEKCSFKAVLEDPFIIEDKYEKKNYLMKSWTNKHTKSSAIILIFPTAPEIASNKDLPGPAYCHKKVKN